MATHGTLSAFESSTTNWRSYAEQLNYYFIANEITTDKKKVAILLSACGQPTFNTISSLVTAEALKSMKYGELIQLLSDHYDPAPSAPPLFRDTNSTTELEQREKVLLILWLP